MYSKILVPLDGSKLAECALPYAEELAKGCNTDEIILVSVTERVQGYQPMEDPSQPLELRLIPEAVGKNERQVQRYLDRIAKAMEAKGIKVSTEVLLWPPAEAIIGYVEQFKCDLIVMATHGRTGISRWALGSVANKVVRATERPVGLIRAKGARPDVREKGILKKALVPLDGSKEGEAVIPYIEELALKLKAEVVLLQVLSTSYQAITAGAYGYVIYADQKIESDKAFARDYLEKVGAQLKQKGVAVESEVRLGIAAEEIIKLADEMYADVAAMSTHGRSGVRRWVFGSVADRVLHEGNTPLLLVRPS